jgi:hypothetical protein
MFGRQKVLTGSTKMEDISKHNFNGSGQLVNRVNLSQEKSKIFRKINQNFA